ncbi:Protein of unknown function [Gryllus bimaculatus]|nr:Protein of unknown function [Gryllus bimaculatus]
MAKLLLRDHRNHERTPEQESGSCAPCAKARQVARVESAAEAAGGTRRAGVRGVGQPAPSGRFPSILRGAARARGARGAPPPVLDRPPRSAAWPAGRRRTAPASRASLLRPAPLPPLPPLLPDPATAQWRVLPRPAATAWRLLTAR